MKSQIAVIQGLPNFMKCPHCGHPSSGQVMDSRPSGLGIRRRRACTSCGKRYSTIEVVLGNGGPGTAAIVDDEVVIQDRQNLCIDCVYCTANEGSYECWSGKNYSLVDGKRIPLPCRTARSATGECGPDGKFWEPKR